MKPKPQTITQFLSTLSPDKRTALNKLRKMIHSVVPKAEECISYGVPAFRLNGKMLVAFGAATRHCSFYPGALPIKVHAAELKGYHTSKGTLRFPADSPLPASLVRKLVKTRVEQHTATPKPTTSKTGKSSPRRRQLTKTVSK